MSFSLILFLLRAQPNATAHYLDGPERVHVRGCLVKAADLAKATHVSTRLECDR